MRKKLRDHSPYVKKTDSVAVSVLGNNVTT
jgi:hypothetical protein